MNIHVMTGRVGSDPELRSTSAGKKVTNLSIAVYTGKTANGEAQSEWFDWVIWEDLAERVCQNVRKGDMVMLSGKASKANRKTRSGEEFKAVMFVASEVYWSKRDRIESTPAPMPEESEELPF